MPFSCAPLAGLPDVLTIDAVAFRDARGWLAEVYRTTDFVAIGLPDGFTQENQLHFGHRGVLRGLHYQKQPHAQGKLVRCVRGQVLDVAVDLRRGSPTYGRWAGVVLSDDLPRMLWIPIGFAHGVQSLTDVADVIYKATAEYASEGERTIRWDDPTIGISWPVTDPLVSARDRAAPLLAQADNEFTWAAR